MRASLLLLLPLAIVACDPGKTEDDSGSGTTDTDGTDDTDDTDDTGEEDEEEECPEPVAFDYNDQASWSASSPDCAGSHQSPIDITLDGLELGTTPTLAFSYGTTPVSIVNNGHSVEYEVEAGAASFTMESVQ